MGKLNCIIDTDPGVDDATAIALSLYDEVIDVKLVTTVSGNLGIDKVTRNILHVLELFKREDIPVAKGSAKPLRREPKNAKFVHQEEGLGNYIPPITTKKLPINKDAIDAMYDTICKYSNNISIVALGPLTNIAKLLLKYPNVTKKINRIYTEGCSPYGWEEEGERWYKYISFNASSDPEAVHVVLNSGIPITYVRSRFGREVTHLTEEFVNSLKDINDVGKFIYLMFSGYSEMGYTDKRTATNDTCAVLAFRFPELFKTEKVNFRVNTLDMPGRTDIEYSRDGNVDFVVDIDVKKVHEYIANAIKKLDFIKIFEK